MLKDREKFSLRTVGDKFYLLYVDKNIKYTAPIELNETGEFIVRNLMEGKSPFEVAQMIATEFEVDVKEVALDVQEFLNSMPDYFKIEE